MPKSTCSVEGCDGKYKYSLLVGDEFVALCSAHGDRWRRHGDLGPAEIFKPREGCSVPGCPDPHEGLGFCKRHRRRFHLYGDPEHAEHPGRWAGDEVGYHGVHHRLRKLYGSATEHACRQCGGPATQWAYDHADPDERQDPKRGPYSIDLAHYLPLCNSCHKKMDMRRPQRQGRRPKAEPTRRQTTKRFWQQRSIS